MKAPRTVTPAPEKGTAKDDGLTATARDLVEVLAPALGLAPGAVTVHTGELGGRAQAHGARGLTEGTHVYLAPGAFDPATPAGRALLAHELAHVAQQQSTVDRPLADAEGEARELARAAAEGRPLWRPAALLPPGARAADNGTVSTLTRPASPTAGTKPLTADQQLEVDLGLLRGELGRIVDRRYQAVRAELIDKLDGWWVSAGDVRSCLRVLDSMPFLLAKAVVRSLPEKRRTDLGRNIENEHHRAYPGPALAALSALDPMLLRWLEVTSLEGIDPTGLGPVVRRAAIEVLQHVRPGVLAQLFQGERAGFFHDLMKGPLPPGTDLKALQELVKQEQAEEAAERIVLEEPGVRKELAEVRRLLTDPSGEDAKQAVAKLAALAPVPPPPSKEDVKPPGKEEPKVPGRADPPDPGPRLRYAVRALDRDGLIDRMLDALPESTRQVGSEYAGRLVVVLAGREPYRTLILVESLLSYSAFFSIDLWITDAEARFAYLLMRSLPLDMQDRWKRWDEGKWFARLEENIPDEDKLEGRYGGIGTGADPFDPAVRQELLKDVTATVNAINKACQLVLTGAKAVELIRMLLMLGQPETGRGKTQTRYGKEARRVQLAAAVRRLDALGHLDRILEELPDSYLMHEMWRGELMEIFAARDPRHVERHARKLLETGFFVDWAVTAREAFLVAQMIGNLSAADQERFKAADPDRWAKIQGEMTPEMRASLSQTNIGGRVAIDTRERLRDRVRDRRLWTGDRAVELRSLLIQLFALNDRRWVWLHSRDVKAYHITGLEEMVKELGLYRPDKPNFEPEQLRSTRFWQEGPFQVLGEWARYALVGLEMLWLALPSLFTRTVRVKGASVAHFQWAMGGDMAGARLLDDADARREDEERKRTGAPEPNRLSLSVTPYAGYLTLRLPRLELSGMARAWPGGSLHTGRVTLTGLDIVAHFSDPGYHTPVGAKAKFDTARVNDAVLASESLPGGLLGVTRLGLDALTLKSGGKGTEDLSEREKDGWIGVPVIGPLLQVLSNVLYLYGGLPGLSNISDMALSPLTAGTPYLAKKFTNFTAGEIFSQVANSAIGLVTDGVFRPPRGVEERLGDAAAMLRALAVSFDAVTVEGLSFAGIQQINKIEIGKTFLGLGRSLPTQLRAEKASLQLRLRRTGLGAKERADLADRVRKITEKLAKLEPLEDELDRLEARHRWNESALSPAERKHMAELSQQIRQTGGGALDIESIRITGLTGLVETAGVQIGPIHAETATQTRWGEYLTDDELIKRFQAEKPPRDAKEALRGTRVSATVGEIRLLPPDTPGQPRLRLHIGRPPTVPEAEEMLRKLPVEPATEARRKMLTWWTTPPAGKNWPAPLSRLWALESMDPEPVGFLGRPTENPRGAEREQELQELRERARLDFGLSVGDLSISGVTARLDPDTLEAQLNLAEMEAADIRYAGYTIRKISGKNVGTAVPPDISAEGDKTYRDLVPGVAQVSIVGVESPAKLRADSLTVEGVQGPGLDLKRLSVTGLRGSVAWEGDEIRIPDLTIASAEVEGVSYRSPGRTIFATGTTKLGRTTADISISTVQDEEGNRKVSEALVRALRIERVDADHVGMDVTSPEPGYRVEAVSGGLVGVWVRDLAIDLSGTNMPVTGSLGIEQLDRLRFEVLSRVLQGDPKVVGQPTTIKGALSSPEVEAGGRTGAVSISLDYIVKGGTKYDVTSVDLRAIALTDGELGTGDNKIKFTMTGAGGRVRTSTEFPGVVFLEGLRLEDNTLTSIDWSVEGGGKITARGSTKLTGISVDGQWESTPDTKTETGEIRTGKKRLQLDHLHVNRITSDNLSYRDGDLELHLGRSAVTKSNLLDIHDVDLRGLVWERPAGAKKGEISAGQIDIGKTERRPPDQPAASVEFAGRLLAEHTAKDVRRGKAKEVQEALFVAGTVNARTISLRFGEHGRISTRATGVGGDIGIGTTKEAMEQHLAFSGLDTGLIDIYKDHIDIGPQGSPGLDLKSLTVDGLDWKSPDLSLSLAQDTGYLTLIGITARARIELNPAGHPGGRLKRLLLRELVVSRAVGMGLTVTLGDGTRFWLDSTDKEMELGKIQLLPPEEGGDGFELAAGQTGKGLQLRGRLDVAGLQLQRVGADIAGFLKGTADVGASRLKVGFFGAAGMRLDLSDPKVENIEATLAGDPRRTLIMMDKGAAPGSRPRGFRAKNITYKQTTGPRGEKQKELAVTGTEISGLEVKDDRYGLRVFVSKATVPEANYDITKGLGTLSRLDIEDADLTVDLRTLLRTGGGGSGASFRTAADVQKSWDKLIADLAPYSKLVDHLDGTLDFDVKDQDKMYPVRASFVDGSLDYARLGGPLFAEIPGVEPYFDLYKGRLSLRLRVRGWLKAVLLQVSPEILLDLEDKEILYWDLPADEVGPARKDHLIRLRRLVEPSPEARRHLAKLIEKLQDIKDMIPGAPNPSQRFGIVNINGKDLSIKNPDEAYLDLGGANFVVLAPGALVGLNFSGSIEGTSAVGNKLPGKLQAVSLGSATVARSQLVFDGVSGRTTVNTGTIGIQDLHDTSLEFDGMTPTILTAHIKKAFAEDVGWSLPGGKR